MHRRIAESPVSALSQSHSLSGCDESHIDSGWAGIYVEVDDYGDGSVLLPDEEEPPNLAVPCDDPAHGHGASGMVEWRVRAVCDGWRLVLGPGQRSFIPHSSGQVVGAWPAQTSGGVS